MAYGKSGKKALALSAGMILAFTFATATGVQPLDGNRFLSGPPTKYEEFDLDLPCDPDIADSPPAVSPAMFPRMPHGAESLPRAATGAASYGMSPFVRSPVLRL